MGVFELENFMKTCLKDGLKNVSVEEEIEKFKK